MTAINNIILGLNIIYKGDGLIMENKCFENHYYVICDRCGREVEIKDSYKVFYGDETESYIYCSCKCYVDDVLERQANNN